MPYSQYFSPDYFTARRRFRAAAARRGLVLSPYPIAAGGDVDEPLTIDAAIREGDAGGRAVVLSSGLHGVEGFFGSAVQLALLESETFDEIVPKHFRLVLLHALNPYGFAQRRRFNKDNIDLNRNFLLTDETYAGSPQLYPQINGWLNPPSPPRRCWPVPLRGVADLLRHGRKKLFAAIPAGQYDFPLGLFYGGSEPAQSTRIVQEHLPAWLGDAKHVVHLDFHTGLGKHGTYALLLDNGITDAQSYISRGSFGHWCGGHFTDRHYHFATAEFGTYGPMRVLLALRAENRAHHWGDGAAGYQWAKQQLVEAFAPASEAWRERVVCGALRLIRTATLATV